MQVFFGVVAYCLTSFIIDCYDSRYLLVDVGSPLMPSKGASRALGQTGDSKIYSFKIVSILLGNISSVTYDNHNKQFVEKTLPWNGNNKYVKSKLFNAVYYHLLNAHNIYQDLNI